MVALAASDFRSTAPILAQELAHCAIESLAIPPRSRAVQKQFMDAIHECQVEILKLLGGKA